MAATKAQDLAAGVSAIDSMPVITENTTVTERAPMPGFDVFSVLPEERKEYGVQDNETLAWIRNPAHWEKIEHSDRIREFGHERPGARCVYRDGVEHVTNGDLVLMAYPTALKEAEEKARTEEYNAHVNQEAPDLFPRDGNRLRQAAEEMRRQHTRDGMTGPQSPTSGLPYGAALTRYTNEQIDAEEARYRRGTRQQSFSNDDWAKMIDGQRGTDKRTSRKSVSMGDSGFGRNPNSAVAQAARKSAGGR